MPAKLLINSSPACDPVFVPHLDCATKIDSPTRLCESALRPMTEGSDVAIWGVVAPAEGTRAQTLSSSLGAPAPSWHDRFIGT